MFRAVLLPPRITGITWSNSRRSREPQWTHCPTSCLHTSIRTSDGIAARLGSLLSPAAGCDLSILSIY
jgi:hypothetical protein